MNRVDKILKNIESDLNHTAHNLATEIDRYFYNELAAEEDKKELAQKIAAYFEKRIEELL